MQSFKFPPIKDLYTVYCPMASFLTNKYFIDSLLKSSPFLTAIVVEDITIWVTFESILLCVYPNASHSLFVFIFKSYSRAVNIQFSVTR